LQFKLVTDVTHQTQFQQKEKVLDTRRVLAGVAVATAARFRRSRWCFIFLPFGWQY